LKTLSTTLIQHVIITDVTTDGIDTIEDQEKFKLHFSHEINLGLYKFSWGATER